MAMSMPGLPFAIGLALANFSSPARIRVLLRRPGGLVGPYLAGCLARLDRILLGRGVALLGRSHQRRIDDLTAHGEIAAFLELAVKIGEHRVERSRLGQLLAEQPDGVGIGCRRAKSKPRKRNQLSRSRIRYSIRASATLFCAAKTSTLSIATGSYGGRPPFAPSP
jgi:hypothetical protein